MGICIARSQRQAIVLRDRLFTKRIWLGNFLHGKFHSVHSVALHQVRNGTHAYQGRSSCSSKILLTFAVLLCRQMSGCVAFWFGSLQYFPWWKIPVLQYLLRKKSKQFHSNEALHLFVPEKIQLL